MSDEAVEILNRIFKGMSPEEKERILQQYKDRERLLHTGKKPFKPAKNTRKSMRHPP